MDLVELKAILQKEYDIDVSDIVSGPRGFVAETFIITSNEVRYFVKFVNKPLFRQKILASVEIQYLLHRSGFERMNYPIRSIKGEYCIVSEDSVLLVYNYIDAEQSYDYDLRAMGRLEADLHQRDSTSLLNIKQEDFQPQEALSFPDVLQGILESKSNDPIEQDLTRIFHQQEVQLDSDYQLFTVLLEQCRVKAAKYDYVVTHGDAGGNTLVKTPTDLYLIDWDEIILAPAERDIWTLWLKPEFQKGYREISPLFTIDTELYHYYILMMHFTYIIHYLNEIRSSRPLQYRQKTLTKMSKEIADGWIKPYLEIARQHLVT
jgi:thiamine kinase-like enzyme